MKKNIYSTIVVVIVLFLTFTINAQKKSDYIYLSGTKFTYPLIQQWVNEYTKIHPSAHIKIQNVKQANDSTNIKIVAHPLAPGEIKAGEEVFNVSRFALLPITNVRNIEPKIAFKKGITQEELKKLFFIDPLSVLENDDKKQPQLTVYTRANQACSSISFANHFGQNFGGIKGKKISGDDQFLIVAVQKDSTGITYNNLGYIYDLTNRTPIKGIKIIPIDINENGKIDKEEQIYDNLDKLTAYLDNNQNNKSIPEDNVSFILDKNKENALTTDFINWILSDGQKYTHQYGFLNNLKENNTQISQNITR